MPIASPPTAPARKVLGGFEILSKIGQGAMGAVFKASQRSLDRVVALKVLPPKIVKRDPLFVDRFIREARVSAKLNHPNIVRAIEVGQDEATGLYYFAMEYIDGPTVRQVLQQEGALEEQRALQVALGVAQALTCAHKAGIVHRDIKPDNILLTSRGEPKLADLGLAKRVAEGSEEELGQPLEESLGLAGPTADASLTLAGKTMGTPYYMSPEQVEGKTDEVDCRSDLYALGATLFHMLTGRAPFLGTTSMEIMRARLTGKPLPLRKLAPKTSPATERIVARLMQNDKAKRFQTPAELAKALEELLDELERARSSPAATPKSALPQSKAALEAPKPKRKARPNATARGVGLPAIAALILLLAVGGILFLATSRSGNPQGTATAKEPPAPSEDSDRMNRQTMPPAELLRPARTDPVVEKLPTPPVGPPSKIPEPAPAVPLAPAAPPPASPAPPVELGLKPEVPVPPEKPIEAPIPPSTPASARWAEEVLEAVRKGAEFLTDGREFNLETRAGVNIQVGGTSTSKALGVGEQEIKVRSIMGDKHFDTPIALKSLTPQARLKLAFLAPLPKADAAVLKAKWAFVELAALDAAPELEADFVKAIEKSLAEARAAGAPDVLLNESQPLLERAKARLPALALKPEPSPEKPLPEKKKDALEAPAEPGKAFNLKQARVGDWAEWRHDSWFPQGSAVVRESVLSKNGNKAMVARDQTGIQTVRGVKSTSNLRRLFDLDASYRPVLPGFMALDISGTPNDSWKVTEGEETLQISGKAYPCHWKRIVLNKGNLEQKVWTCAEVPLGGIVKVEEVSVGRKSTTLLMRFGQGAGE